MKFLFGLIIGMFLPFMLAGAWAGATAWSFGFFKNHFGLALLVIIGIFVIPMFFGKKKRKNKSFSSKKINDK